MTRDDDVVQAASNAEVFDADWYLAAYPDVALSGLSPQEHYRKFGLIMGRAANAHQQAARQTSAPRPQATLSQPHAAAARFSRSQAVSPADLTLPGGGADSPIIPAPAGYSPSPEPVVDPGRPGGAAPLAVRAGGLEIARLPDLARLQQIIAPLAAYCRMFSPDNGAGGALRDAFEFIGQDRLVEQASTGFADQLDRAADPGGAGLQSGRARIANAWYVNEGGLRFFLAEGDEEPRAESDTDQPAVLRVFQAPPDRPGAVQLVGMQPLSDQNLGFFDAALLNPLMPVLLELSDEAGRTIEIGLLPFPSLLRGGIHAAETAALQLGADPMAETWRLSRALLAELCPEAGCAAALSIAAIEIETSHATGAERLMSAPVRDWLGSVFGLRVRAHETTPPLDAGARHVFETLGNQPGLTSRTDRPGLVLELPAVAVPSLSALCSRRLDLGEHIRVAGPFLVADAVSCRPQWSVAMPLLDSNLNTAMRYLPRLRAGGGPRLRLGQISGRDPHWLAPLHLAIRFAPAIPPRDIQILQPLAPDASMRRVVSADAFSLALQVSDPARTERFLQSLAAQRHGGKVAEILLCHPKETDSAILHETVQKILPDARLVSLPGSVRLDDIAERMSGEAVLLAEDNVVLYDPQVAAVLSELLAGDPQAASVSCVLLHEVVQKGRSKVQVASGGIFPAAVSFTSAPRLGIAEPDCLAALSETSYPVLANSFRLCLIRKSALIDTRAARAGRAPAGASADLGFGLDAFAAGYRSLCTSRVRAGTTAAPTRRDEIDPFGLACLLPARWDDLLGAVTVLRPLRG